MLIEQFLFRLKESGNVTTLIEFLRYLRTKKHYNILLLISIQLYPYYSFDHEFLNEIAIAMYFVGRFAESWNLYIHILENFHLSDRHTVIYGLNSNASLNYIFPKTIDVNRDISQLQSPYQRLVTFTITTCKRYDLFIRTMDSFLKYCKDIHLITRWICIDDNSSDEERKNMSIRYPFFEFIWKSENEKGHVQSMNMILDTVDTPYIFHMEDDWQFISSRNYISDCLQILQEDQLYGQCLVNRCYAETLDDYSTIGSTCMKTKNNLRYLKHNYEPDTNKFIHDFGYGKNCAYWSHYSLRPGMNKTHVLNDVGRYTPNIPHFEKEYSIRYHEKGYITVFLERIHCIHIGRLTSEMHSDIPNAYTLNNVRQF